MRLKKALAELYPGYDLDAPAIKAPIEKGMQPVCDALNSIDDVFTLWSCEGHPERPSLPYVVFIAPVDTAFKLSKVLRCRDVERGLKYYWELTASFRDDGSLQYLIKPSDYRLSTCSCRRNWFVPRQWKKSEMDDELFRLAKLLEGRPW